MRATLLPLALGALLLSSLSACSVNYYVGGTRYQAPAPQPGYDYDYPAPQPAPGPVVVGPVRTPPPPPIRSNPPIRTNPPVRNPPIRTNPTPTNPQPGNPSPGQPTTNPNGGGVILPTAPPKPIPGTGPVKEPEILPTAPPKPIPNQPSAPSQQPAPQPSEEVVLPTAPPKPIPGPTRQPELPTAPPKPIPGGTPASDPHTDPAHEPTKGPEPVILPTAPPKPIRGGSPAPDPRTDPAHEPVRQPSEPVILPTAPPKPIPVREQPVRQREPETPTQREPEVLPTAPPKPIPADAEPAPQREGRGRVREAQTPLGFNQQAPAQGAGAPVLVLRKTPCLGPCPHFEASIYADGRVHYVGHRNVDKVGTFELQLPAGMVSEMVRQVNEINFYELQDQYLSGATDMPSTFLTYQRPGHKPKTVQVEEGGPEELRSLLTYITNRIESISSGAPEH